jgi:cytochrome c553
MLAAFRTAPIRRSGQIARGEVPIRWPWERRRLAAITRRSALLLLASALVAAAAAGCGGTKTVTKTVTVVGTIPNGGATSVSASVAAGAHDFVQFACAAQCHGARGRGGVSADVPALSQIGKQLTVAQLKRIRSPPSREPGGCVRTQC